MVTDQYANLEYGLAPVREDARHSGPEAGGVDDYKSDRDSQVVLEETVGQV